MEYPYLTTLSVVILILKLFIGLVVFYFLVRLFNKKITFLTALKGILLYQLISLVFSLIYPDLFLMNNIVLMISDLLLFTGILFLIFYFITKKYFTVSWKKSLILFVLVNLIFFPILSLLYIPIEEKLSDLPIFTEEKLQLRTQTEEWFESGGILKESWPSPLSLEIINKIETGMFSHFLIGERIKIILITIQIS